MFRSKLKENDVQTKDVNGTCITCFKVNDNDHWRENRRCLDRYLYYILDISLNNVLQEE